MITYLLLSLLSILIIITNYIDPIQGQTVNHQINGRVFPGCALIKNTIYCFGGFEGSATNNGPNYNSPINDHVALDLTNFGDFSVIQRPNIQWVTKSNTVNGNPFGAVGQIASTTFSDGSYAIYGGRYTSANTQPFAVYHPDSDQWDGISLPDNNTSFVFTQIVNIGNDKVWIWGGSIARSPSETLVSDRLYNYNYPSNLWSTGTPSSGTTLSYHTATLANNIIYLIGGVSYSNGTLRNLVDLNNFRTYNTIDNTWGNITALGSTARQRSFHTTVATSDNKNLIIYGGSQYLKGGFRAVDDTYYVYDIQNNNLQNVTMVNPPGANTHHRFGHFATLYNSTYLVLVFGYSDASTATADNFNVLNVQNITNPQWVSFIGANNPDSNGNDGVNLKTVIPAVIVPIVVVLSAAAIAAFLIIRRRKRKQEKQFILEQEDPRNFINEDLDNNGTLFTDEVEPEARYYSNNYRNEHDTGRTSDHREFTKPFDSTGYSKPIELNETTKPFQNGP